MEYVEKYPNNEYRLSINRWKKWVLVLDDKERFRARRALGRNFNYLLQTNYDTIYEINTGKRIIMKFGIYGYVRVPSIILIVPKGNNEEDRYSEEEKQKRELKKSFSRRFEGESKRS